MHVHTERTTADKLEAVLDSLLADPGIAGVEPHFLGARDWLVIAYHGEHMFAELVTGSPIRLEETYDRKRDSWQPGIEVGYYAAQGSVSPGGAVRPPGMLGWIEDKASTWILYIGADGRPEGYYPDREPSGAVIGSGILLSDEHVITEAWRATQEVHAMRRLGSDDRRRSGGPAIGSSRVSVTLAWDHDAVADRGVQIDRLMSKITDLIHEETGAVEVEVTGPYLTRPAVEGVIGDPVETTVYPPTE